MSVLEPYAGRLLRGSARAVTSNACRCLRINGWSHVLEDSSGATNEHALKSNDVLWISTRSPHVLGVTNL